MKKIKFSLKNIVKILVINLLVLLSLLIILNLSAVLIYNAYQSYEMVWGYLTGKNSPIPEKALLPNYQNID